MINKIQTYKDIPNRDRDGNKYINSNDNDNIYTISNDPQN